MEFGISLVNFELFPFSDIRKKRKIKIFCNPKRQIWSILSKVRRFQEKKKDSISAQVGSKQATLHSGREIGKKLGICKKREKVVNL